MKYKKFNIINIILVIVIFLLILYIVKIGGINLVNKIRDNKKIKTTLVSSSSTTSTSKKNTTSSTTTSAISSTINTTTTNKISEQPASNNVDLKIIEGILIVNKSYPLPSNYVPKNAYKDATGLNYCSNCLDKDLYQKYQEMEADAKSIGLNIWIQSGYRSFNLQESLYNKYVNRDGKDAADRYSARPGHSEHQTGLAFDLNSVSDDFQYTNEGIWINNNCYKYGFILRYPKGKEHITGYKYESWHLRYVGVDLAKKLYNNGDWITLEEYFNLTSTYNN